MDKGQGFDPSQGGGKEAAASGDQGTSEATKLVIEGKEFTADQVKGLVEAQAGMTQKSQKVQKILDVCERHGVDPEAYLSHAEGAFAVMADLVDRGLIDEQGNVKTESKPQEKEDKSSNKENDWLKSLGLHGEREGKEAANEFKGAERVAAMALKAISPNVTKLVETNERLQRQLDSLTRMQLQDKIQAKFPVLDEEDVSKVFAAAMGDKTKTLFQHAQTEVERKKVRESEIRSKYAKEFKVDLKEFDENQLNEQDAKGGTAPLFKGKKFSFRGGKDSVHPREATKEFFRRQREQ